MATTNLSFIAAPLNITSKKALPVSPVVLALSYGRRDANDAIYTALLVTRQSKMQSVRVIVKDVGEEYTCLEDRSIVRLLTSYLVFDDGDRPMAIYCCPVDIAKLGNLDDPNFENVPATLNVGYVYCSFAAEVVSRSSNLEQVAKSTTPDGPAVARWALSVHCLDQSTHFVTTFAITRPRTAIPPYLSRWRPGRLLLVTGLFRGLLQVTGYDVSLPEFVPSDIRELQPTIVGQAKAISKSHPDDQNTKAKSQSASKKRKAEAEGGSTDPNAETAIEGSKKPRKDAPDSISSALHHSAPDPGSAASSSKGKEKEKEKVLSAFAPPEPYTTPPRLEESS